MRMQVNVCGRRWMKVDTGRRSCTKVVLLKQYFHSLSISICKVGLYNLNYSVDLKDQLLSLSYLLKIFEMS